MRERLPGNEIHVWLAFPEAIRDPDLLRAYHEMLSEAERARRRRFAFEKGRHEFLVSHALLRSVLSVYGEAEPAAWRFVTNRYGRPELVPEQREPPLRFNLSHTDKLIACAVVLEREIGVDVEWTGRRGQTVAIADRYFSQAEVRALRALPVARQRERFFSYWTLKESYIKARGMGLSLPLDRFSFLLDEAPPIRIAFDPRLRDDPQRWQFDLRRPTPEHVLALGIARGQAADFSIRVRHTVPGTPS